MEKNKIILAGLFLENQSDAENQFEESRLLAQAKGYEVVGEIIQKRRTPHPTTYFGEGKILEISKLMKESCADACMIAEKITPSQMRTLNEAFGKRVFDRHDCILEIFADRAQTKQAKLQVQLAILKHELPYVIHTEQNFSRMRGGNKNKGEGEKQYQLNQRKLEARIQRVEKDLKEVKRSLQTMKKRRVRSSLPLVSFVGYTNAGKSTCMNQILKLCDSEESKEVFVKDMLFATLDTSVRKVSYQGIEFLLSDTVGFVSNLPHELVDAFHSTLEEVCDADLILQVLDESSEKKMLHREVTEKTLNKLEASEKEMWILHNKCDLAGFKKNEKNHFYISASNNQGLVEVLDAIAEKMRQRFVHLTLQVHYDQMEIYSFIQKKGKILSVTHDDENMEIEIEIRKEYEEYLREYVKEK